MRIFKLFKSEMKAAIFRKPLEFQKQINLKHFNNNGRIDKIIFKLY